jgi:hypothetical protein
VTLVTGTHVLSNFTTDDVIVAELTLQYVPEPGTGVLLASAGLAAIAVGRRRIRRASVR